jgi:hypothetical protein
MHVARYGDHVRRSDPIRVCEYRTHKHGYRADVSIPIWVGYFR